MKGVSVLSATLVVKGSLPFENMKAMDLHDFCETWAVLLAAEKLLGSPEKLLDLLKTVSIIVLKSFCIS